MLAAISLGSNLGNKKASIKEAIKKLARLPQTRVLAVSAFYETEPVDYQDQDWFVNAAITVETRLLADDLLQKMLKIEDELLRVREFDKGPRTIDLDLLLYGDLVQETEFLTLPHPRMHQRRFVLEPLNTIAGEWLHPLLLKKISELLGCCKDTAVVRVLPD